MRCPEALDAMLAADPAELAGRSESRLSRHIRGCERCRPVAAALTAELRQIEDALGAFGRANSAGVAGAPTLPIPWSGRVGGPGRVGRSGARPLWRRTVPWRAWLPLAAAAVIAAVLLLPDPEPDWTGASVSEALNTRVGVRPPADRNAVVMSTENPNITIVWLYEEEGT